MLSEMRPKTYLSNVSEQPNANHPDLDWRDHQTLTKLQARRGQRDRKTAALIRNHLRSYYNGIGAVPWQENSVLSHVRITFVTSSKLNGT